MGAVIIPSDYGYIAFVVVAAFVTVTYLALQVGRARAKYGVKRLSAVFGLIYLAGRIVYAHGYYTFNPANRNRGAFGYIGFFGLLINTVIFGLTSTGFI
ncbi:hypothetical protein EGW08_004766 [Elysia chlorotica]|uniref:Uncharacterized protein n=1 Tax=Elysia chlorotica TaxID=188477 RepID=A0A433U0W8_ELYCH|nr:hypothetical protein EGW08_004766 [Elysia chlorotica]